MRSFTLSIFVTLACSTIGFAATINVPTDYSTIQTAIDAAQNGDTILVEAGTYSERIDFLGKALTVESVSGSTDTIIDGSSSGTVVTFANGEQSSSVLDGFTIQGGSNYYGGGVLIVNSFPVIQNCLITSNQASLSGGGIYVDTGSIQLTNTTITSNVSDGAGGGIYLKFSFGSISGGSLLDNSANSGGALYAKDGIFELFISDVTIQGNIASSNGGGVYDKNSDIVVSNCNFDLNTASTGGAWFSYISGDATITNSVFTDNSVSDVGGAASVRSNSTVYFDTCTFDSNVADTDCDTIGGGAILNIANSSVTLENPTICSNMLCGILDTFYGDAPIIIGDIVDCTLSDGPGACCGGSACWLMEEIDCAEGGGLWNGSGSSCATVVCEGGGGTTTGACCVQSNCVHATELSCGEAGGVFYGTSETCGTTDCPTDCAEDVNGDGVVDINDLLSLIGAWGVCP